MSRYQPRIIINNPEKNVPDNIVEQFFLTIKTGDIDQIRNFVMKHKNKYNLVDRGSKGSTSDSGKTPFHVILELDDKVADEDTKLRVIKYLGQMGAPMDLPDSADVWPIHLAAALQSEDIIDYLVRKKVNLNRKDSSNNTPLHYAIMGKEISCPKTSSIKSLVPEQKIDKLPLNTTLERANNKLTKIISSNEYINDNLMHIINTIMKIPDMYAEDKISRNLETEVINIFANVALTPTYSGGFNTQQQNLEQLIDRTYSTINDDLLSGLTNPLNIAPNNGGWGPKIPTGNPSPNDYREPSILERIMADDRVVRMREIDNEYVQIRNSVTSMNTNIMDKTVRTIIPSMITIIDYQYINKLIFCPECERSNYGEDVTLTKMLYLLIWNDHYHYMANYGEILANKIMEHFKLMNNLMHLQIMNAPSKASIKFYSLYTQEYLFQESGNITDLIDDPTFQPRTRFDKIFSDAIDYVEHTIAGAGVYDKCIFRNLLIHFTESDDLAAQYLENSILNDPMRVLLADDLFEPYIRDFIRVKPAYLTDSSNWFVMLENLIDDIRPIAVNPDDDIFFQAGVYIIPTTTLPSAPKLSGTDPRHTAYEMVRIMHLLGTFLMTGNFQATSYPKIFNVEISDWLNYIDNIGSKSIYRTTTTIANRYPLYIYLYKILATYIQNVIKQIIIDCVDNVLNHILSLNPAIDPSIASVHQYFGLTDIIVEPFDDAFIYNLLLPSEPEPTQFNDTSATDPLADLKNHKWEMDNKLVQWFYIIKENIPSTLMDNIVDLMVDPANINNFNYANLNNVRQIIETNAIINMSEINSIIHNRNFRNNIRSYFGTYFPTNIQKPKWPDSINILPRFNTITNNISLLDVFDRNLAKLAATPQTITHKFFLTEVYGYYFVLIKQMLQFIGMVLTGINNVIADIISFINNGTYYYIPQIFLPALIKQMIVVVSYLIIIRNNLIEFNNLRSQFMPYIDLADAINNSIITLGEQFIDYVNKQLNIIYTNIVDVIKYHNSIIDFLNYNSSYQLIQQTGNKYQLFTMNLIQIENFPDIFTSVQAFENLLNILRTYRIPEMLYYSRRSDSRRLRFDVFGNIINNRFINYRDIIDYGRTGTIANSPIAGENLQLNITVNNPANPNIMEIPQGIAGEWLNFDPENPNGTSYNNAFIGYLKKKIPLVWPEGMPASIRRLASRHLLMTKQRIVEETLQHIIDNKNKDPADASSTKNLYDSIKGLGNTTTYTEVDEVKVYVVIAKLVDATISRLIQSAIRQSISTWIYKFISKSPRYHSLTDIDKKMVDIIRQRDYLKMALNELDKEAVEKLLALNSKHSGFNLLQIEPTPSNLPYSTKPTPNELIHYLYNINYFTTGDVGPNKKCYRIDPEIASKLVIPETINSKNSDGNTPMHIAVGIHHTALVEMLLAKGANPNSFKNNQGLTPQDIIIDHTKKHIDFTNGKTVLDSINNFVVPFNDLLLARLRDDKYGNNIVKDVTLAIPIQLVMYNHMFHLYLQNYRFNFSIELKTAIMQLFKKYFNLTPNIYPIDLFEIDEKQIYQVLEQENIKSQTKTIMSSANRKRIETVKTQLELLDNQINGLIKEKQQTTDPEQIKFIDDILAELIMSKTNYGTKLANLEAKATPPVDAALPIAYNTALTLIVRRIGNRNLKLVEYYQTAFNGIGKNNKLYLAIWNNYLQKDLENAPSMIFSLINKILNHLINQQFLKPFDAEEKTELNNIVNFMNIVVKYIESKNSYPTNISDDNPILVEEFEHIIYLINLIITPAMRNIILNQIYEGLKDMDAANTIITNQDAVLDEILTVEFNGDNIDRFLNSTLPKLATKYFTTIYTSSDDPDRKYTSGNDIFLPIIQIIKANKIILVNDDSILVQNIRDHLIPFMANTYQNFINSLRLAVFGYERYLINTYQLAKILQLLI